MPPECYECEEPLTPTDAVVCVEEVEIHANGDPFTPPDATPEREHYVHVVGCLAKYATLMEEDVRAGRWKGRSVPEPSTTG